MNNILFWTIIIVSSVIALLLLDRIAKWMEAKGWIFYKKRSSASGSAMQAVDVAINPEATYIVEAKRELEEHVVRDDTGAGIKPGLQFDERFIIPPKK